MYLRAEEAIKDEKGADKLTAGGDVVSACRSVGISDATCYNWRKWFGGMGCPQLSELKNLEKETARIREIVAGF